MRNFLNIDFHGYNLFPIGIGTWGVGGFIEKDINLDDDSQINALKYALEQGIYIDQLSNIFDENY